MCPIIIRGRAESDITKWVEYFIEGMADVQGLPDQSNLIRKLDLRQRRALELFQEFETVTSRQIGELSGFKPRTSAQICATWVENGFLEMVDSSNRGRKYKLSKHYVKMRQSGWIAKASLLYNE